MKRELIAYNNPKSPASEMFRTLRTNIQFMNSNKELKTLLVTSALSGEGKSWVSSNLAITFAQAGKKVLIVDADMRKGRQYNLFDITPTPGLSNYLSGIIDGDKGAVCNLSNFIQETEVENLFVITAGDIPPNPSELLVSEKMLNLIKELKEIFDITIFDGTPSLLLADAPILSRIVDSTIIVTAYNETKIDNAKKIQKSIENIGGHIAGVVINKIPASTNRYESSYYYENKMVPTKKSKKRSITTDANARIKNMEKEDLKKNSAGINLEEYNKLKYDDKVEHKKLSQDKTNNFYNAPQTIDVLKRINNYLDEEKRNLKKGDEGD